jgi:hypothetical protein
MYTQKRVARNFAEIGLRYRKMKIQRQLRTFGNCELMIFTKKSPRNAQSSSTV